MTYSRKPSSLKIDLLQFGWFNLFLDPFFEGIMNLWTRMADLDHVIRLTIYGNFSIYIPLGPIFWCEFNDGVHFVIGTIFDNFSIYIALGPFFWCEFNDGVHFVIRLAIFGNFSKCVVYISSVSVFQCEFNHDVYSDIRLAISGNFFVYMYIYMCYTPFFSAHSAIIVFMSSGDYIFTIYDMIITRHCFSVWIEP
jgi:hypothetical protein